jgi:ABC-type Zn uptake system ZnuABC Zn-binding protein ZnuA
MSDIFQVEFLKKLDKLVEQNELILDIAKSNYLLQQQRIEQKQINKLDTRGQIKYAIKKDVKQKIETGNIEHFKKDSGIKPEEILKKYQKNRHGGTS